MPSCDMPLEQMKSYNPRLSKEADFDAFWARTLNEALQSMPRLELIPVDLGARTVDTFAVRFDGFATQGQRPPSIAGWYVRPKEQGKFPAVMHYHGYSGRGQRLLDMIGLASQGIVCMSMDCRGQNGESEETVGSAGGGHHSGWMTQGVRKPDTYYFRYVYADAVRAIEALCGRDEVDSDRIAVNGASQGGALSLAAAALSNRVKLCVSEIPFLCDFPRSVRMTPNGPFPEIAGFLKQNVHIEDVVYKTLSYFDCVNLAPRIRAKTVICNCLWDDICLPSTIYAAYNHLTCDKDMVVFPYHKHEVPYDFAERRFQEMMGL
jgi:cephalosporin-C deacetylase